MSATTVIRYYIVQGDKTTAGGWVVGASAETRIDGVTMAREGDLVRCPACNTTAPIICAGSRSESSWDGRQGALSGDLCACRCRPFPSLLHSQESMRNISYDEPARDSVDSRMQPADAGRGTFVMATALSHSHDQCFCFVDQHGKALAGARYVLRPSTGSSSSGAITPSGHTARYPGTGVLSMSVTTTPPSASVREAF